MTQSGFPVVASVAGKGHRRAGRGAQDAWALVRSGDVVAAAVADGCSAGGRSQVGAGVGARFAAACAARRALEGAPLHELPALVLEALVPELGRLAAQLGIDAHDAAEREEILAEYLLFTVHVALVRGDDAVVFGVGDGVVSVDGAVRVLEQGPAPDYPAYALVPSLPRPRVEVHHRGPFTTSLAIATDGAVELLRAEERVLADGRALGGLQALEQDDRFLKNPSLAQKRLHAWCEQTGGPEDDCTVVVLRRHGVAGGAA